MNPVTFFLKIEALSTHTNNESVPKIRIDKFSHCVNGDGNFDEENGEPIEPEFWSKLNKA